MNYHNMKYTVLVPVLMEALEKNPYFKVSFVFPKRLPDFFHEIEVLLLQ